MNHHVAKISILIMITLLVTCSGAPDNNVFLLAGQSNMGGRGGCVGNDWDKYVPPECEPNPTIHRLNKDLRWEEAVEPIHRDIDFAAGIGPGMPFSTTLLAEDPGFGEIGLVPSAMGATNITSWQRGRFYYNRLLKRALAAAAGGGVIRAMLWYQGESDTTTFENAVLYKARIEQFFNDIRSDLGLPSLPIIQVALAPGKLNATNVEIVRRVQLEMDLPFVACVDAKGLELEPDMIHLSTDAQVRLGEMLAHAFWDLSDQQ